MTSWPHKIKILTATQENAKNQLQNFSQLIIMIIIFRVLIGVSEVKYCTLREVSKNAFNPQLLELMKYALM